MRWADHSYRGVPPNSVSDCDLEIKRSGGLGPLGLSTNAKKDKQIIVLNVSSFITESQIL